MQNFITRPTALLLKGLCICLMVGWLTACSLTRLSYNNGSTIAYWWLNGYIGFDANQSPWVRQRIDQLFAWHRRTQLRDYAEFLASTQKQLQQEVTKAMVLADYEEITVRGDRLIEEVAPDLADLALSMTADNMEKLQKKIASNNQKFREEYLRGDRQEQQEHRYKLIMEWAEYWFGDFSDEQEAAIRRASDQRPLNNEMWMEDRLQRQITLFAMLKRIQLEKPPRDVVARMIKAYISNNNLARPDANPEMRAFFEASKDGFAQLAAAIINLATPRQKNHAKARLQQWMDDFAALASKP